MSNDANDSQMHARRDFMLKALVALPATQVLGACAAAGSPLDEDVAPIEVEAQAEELLRAPRERVQRRRERWRHLLDLHIGSENRHDLPGVMETFSEGGEMIFNRAAFTTPEEIAQGHILFGFSNMPGSLANTREVPERVYYTDDEILVEGKIIGDHIGTIGAFVATNRRVELHYSAFYRFDDNDELVSERVTMNWAPLVTPA
jgi:hypothetical protein